MYDENRRRSCLISCSAVHLRIRHVGSARERLELRLDFPGVCASEDVLKCLKRLPVVFRQRKAWLPAPIPMAEKEKGNRRNFIKFLLCFEGGLR